jgi:hypothetical protein
MTIRPTLSDLPTGAEFVNITGHTLTVFNGVDVPDSVASAVMALLSPYNPDIYTRGCDTTGMVL